MRRRSAFGVVAALASLPIGAGQIMVYGAGTASCGAWIEARKQSTEDGLLSWILGYVTGAEDNTIVQLTHTDYAAMQSYVDKYCGENPLKKLIDAARALRQELVVK